MDIQARLSAAGTVFSGIAADAAAAIGRAFGSVDLTGFGASVTNAGSLFDSILQKMNASANSASQNVRVGFVETLSEAFKGFATNITGVLLPPVVNIIAAIERFLGLADKIKSFFTGDTGGSDAGSGAQSLGTAAAAPLAGVSSALAAGPAAKQPLLVHLDATLNADGYELARVTMRNLDDAASMF